MAEESPRIRWHTICVAVCWALFCFGSVAVTAGFREIYLEMCIMGGLPYLTKRFMSVPAALWIVMGPFVAAGLIVKSRLMSARASGIVDMISVLALLVAGAVEAIVLYLPFTPL